MRRPCKIFCHFRVICPVVKHVLGIFYFKSAKSKPLCGDFSCSYMIHTISFLSFLIFYFLGMYQYLPRVRINTHATTQPACAPATTPEAVTYGSNLLRSRGNSVASRTLSSPISCIVSLSSPIPRPPCGGMPYLKAER